MYIIVLLWIGLLSYSTWAGSRQAYAFQIRIVFNSFRTANYTLGISHKQYKGIPENSREPVGIHQLTVGFFLVALEVEFYRPLQEIQSNE